MSYTLPLTIENKYGERVCFLRMEGRRLIVEGSVVPKGGPTMHVHWLQDESFTVLSGQIGYQVMGQEPCFGGPGTTILFKRGTPHRFWNAGEDELRLSGWIDPADNMVFFLSTLYDAMNRGKDHRPELFDGAFLMRRYRREYDVPEIPVFVKKVVMPTVYAIGKVLGKYRKFENAPQPL